MASSIAARPSGVPGILMNRFGRAALPDRSTAAARVLSGSRARRGETSSDTHPSIPFVRSQMGRKWSAAPWRSSIARRKKISSAARPSSAPARIAPSYDSELRKAWSKIVGFDVSPVIPRSSM